MSETTAPSSPTAPAPGRDAAAPQAAGERDLGVDFLRGVVMFALVVVHVELVSLFTFLVWERIGLVSGAEGFVILSGFVLGVVSRHRVATRGAPYANARLVARATQLYRVNVAVILVVAALSLLPLPGVREITTFTDRFARQTYELYPAWSEGLYAFAGRVLLLRAGPHQLQVLGLYVVLLLAAIPALWMLERGRVRELLAISWIVYFGFKLTGAKPTGAQFEAGFASLAWQVVFLHGLAAGYHRAALERFFRTGAGRAALALAALLAAGFLVYAQATPNPVFPAWSRLPLVSAGTFQAVHARWFDKNTLGLLRVVNDLALLLVLYAVVSRLLPVLERALGWFFVPLGQASLYVFVMHLFLVAIAATVRPFGFAWSGVGDLLVNTLVHAAVLLALWGMVRIRFLFSVVPR